MLDWKPGGDWARFDAIDFGRAATRIADAVTRTPLVPWDAGDPRVELRLKLENRQTIGAFKARGAANNVAQLTADERQVGVVACSSGNHGKALSWAAERAGVPATIVMPEDAYANKIQACRDHGANVVLAPTREEAERSCAALVTEGWTLVHPYDEPRTIEGAGTVGVELAEDWPELEVVVVPVGGGGLLAGVSLALRRMMGARVTIIGAEPTGAPTMTRGLAAGRPVPVSPITTAVQGLCPLDAGVSNIEVCRETLDGVIELSDEVIFDAQRRLVRGGETVEPAGAAAPAAVFSEALPKRLFLGRESGMPLRVVAIVSGGNADPQQLADLRGRA